jgi:hypothetical protein
MGTPTDTNVKMAQQRNGVFCVARVEMLVKSRLLFNRFELLPLEAGSWARGQFGNPE